MKKKARIIYNEEHDAFDVEIETKEGWEREKRFQCVVAEKTPRANAYFIHFSILRKIKDLQCMGYEVKIDI